MKLKLFTITFILFCAPLVIVGQTDSSATIRLKAYDQNNSCYVSVPNNPEWNIEYETIDLLGDLAPNPSIVRRDPSSVLKVNGKYYVWYTYSPTNTAGKQLGAPWDLSDIYYASSTDSYNWEEHGPAIERGPSGSFDHRSAFTTEVFYHDGTFYLIYQAAKDIQGIWGKNTIAMAYANSVNGPWTKLETPVLEPTVSGTPVFDDNAVHDPCIVYFDDKFYLYYKGEGSEENVCGVGVWGLDKQVKWGVAVADSPTGPYVKSQYNPVTNTGHEVCVWNSGEGIGILLYQDGPEYGTLQYASDGVNFDIKGEVENFVLQNYDNQTFPEAAGLYRAVNDENSPVSGVSWGISHRLGSSDWTFLKRFESKDKSIIVDDSDNDGIIVDGTLSVQNLNTLNDKVHIYPNPVKDVLHLKGIAKGKVQVFNNLGALVITDLLEGQTIDTSSLSFGIYIIKISNENEVYTAKFIKE